MLKGLFMISGFLILSAIYGKDAEKKVSTGKGILMSIIFIFWLIGTMLAFTENIALGIIILLSFPSICICWGIKIRKSTNEKTQKDLEQIEKNIASLKQTYQNAVRDIGDVKPEDIEHAYTQGLITKEKFTEIMNSYENLQFMIQSLPLQIEKFEQERLEILNK